MDHTDIIMRKTLHTQAGDVQIAVARGGAPGYGPDGYTYRARYEGRTQTLHFDVFQYPGRPVPYEAIEKEILRRIAREAFEVLA